MRSDLLVVDDSLTVRMDLDEALTGAGYRVTTCATVSEANAELRRRRFALLILDVILPDGDGIELLRQLKARPEYAATPVIMLSNEAEVRSRVRGLTTGAEEYVGKPYDVTYVVKRARQLLQEPRAGGRSAPEQGVGEKKVLAVGPRSAFLGQMADHLRLEHHDVVVAHSADEAVALLSVTPVDCIVVDYTTRELDAIDVALRCRAVPGRESIPLMLLADSKGTGLEQRARAAGFEEIVNPSGSLAVVRARVRGLLRKRQGDRELFSKIIVASGLSDLLARSTLHRACRRAGIDVYSMGPGDIERALPAIREALLIFLSPHEVGQRLSDIAALSRQDPEDR